MSLLYATRPNTPRSAAGIYNPWLIVAMVALAPFMEVLDTTIANVALTHIAGSLAVSPDESTWVLTSYLVSNSIILPITGWLQEVVGRKRLFLICVALFTASSVLCALSTSLSMLIISRVLQGIGGGGLQPVTQSMYADSFPASQRAQVFAVFGVVIIVAPATGPILGGWLTDHLSWHWVFLINLPIGLIAFALIAIFVDEPELLVRERAARLAGGLRFDWFGLLLVAVGFGALQIFLDKFSIDDGFGSVFIRFLFVLWSVSLVTLVVWEWNHPAPVVNVRLFAYRNFAICCLVMFVIGFILLSTTQLLPQLTQTLMGYSSETAGFALALGGLATIGLMPVAGIVTGRIIPARVLLVGGLLETGIALVFQSHLAPTASFFTISIDRVLQVIALPFLFIPISALSYVGLPPARNGDASAIINQVRNIGGSIGISFVTSMLAWRTQFHHSRLAESVTPYVSLHGRTLSQVAAAVQHQAAFMSYLDLFHILGLMALLVWPVVLLLGTPSARAAEGVVYEI
ncbi:MAG TPA: DHA2 family efflux MFS transporter permease subunit [Acidiphilium sp.]|jgi:DHA2 family multidrug resistance protein|uniref:DHA2 family efflux MFS transporter permease subunit n=1 Tax=unclassified Acidiphilium TaxID=2617493 RepID=UPI000BD930B1|nr:MULTISPECIES: DHA2 family efflux MFS transporter permease subunit [unclassified Acidiphilium]OYV56815.1 MAG: MFS transporter [Acidiphilium sp. 20-67-58]OYV85766.1 MAG: MFS transporter [Acidiphilium sp. 21-68-69]HQT60418.1 DHA2 family efflux MFS transporter permease subunit [Acidiphilium sp.]HQU10065.1 DHA2 family efflux MFS transporter permease subunit [Acidiphilium sp.]